MEERRQQGYDNNLSRPCIKKGWGKDLAGELRRHPLDNSVHCQRRGCNKATSEIFGQDDGDAVQDTTHLWGNNTSNSYFSRIPLTCNQVTASG